MIGFEKIRNFIKRLDTKQAYQFIGAILAVVILMMIIMLFGYYRSIQKLQQRLRRVNQQRQITRSILEKNEYVLQQQAKVDEILAQDKNFKIKEYFNGVVQAAGLTGLISKEADWSAQELVPGYTEIKLDVGFSGLNMKQLVDLLYKIEQNERVYTKDLKIIKNLKSPTIDVTLVIATFEATATP